MRAITANLLENLCGAKGGGVRRLHSVAHAPEQLLMRETTGLEGAAARLEGEFHLLSHSAHENVVALQSALSFACNARAQLAPVLESSPPRAEFCKATNCSTHLSSCKREMRP